MVEICQCGDLVATSGITSSIWMKSTVRSLGCAMVLKASNVVHCHSK